MALPVNFKDDVLASSMDGKRRYNMITNSDGTVSFEDVTTYSQEGSNFGSAQINNTNGAINTINNNVLDTIEEISANTSGGKFAGALALKNVNNSFGGMKFGIDSSGNYGYIKAGADSVTPFSSIKRYSYSWTSSNDEQKTLTLEIEPKYIAFTVGGKQLNAVLYDVENQEYIINTVGSANIIASVNGKVVTINTYHGASQVNYLNYW